MRTFLAYGAAVWSVAGCATGGDAFVHDAPADARSSASAAPAHRAGSGDGVGDRSGGLSDGGAETRPVGSGGRDLLAGVSTGKAELDVAFAGAAKILDGFEAPAADGRWRVGDTILLGVHFREDGNASTRFVRYTVRGVSARAYAGAASRPLIETSTGLPVVNATARQARLFLADGGTPGRELTEPSLDLESEVYDASGASLGKGDACLPVASLRTSFPAAAAALGLSPGARFLKAEFDNKKTPEGRRREFLYSAVAGKGVKADAAADLALIAAGTTLFGISDSFRHYGALRDFRRRLGETIVDAPSMLGAVFGGITGELELDAAKAVPATAAEALVVPMARFPKPPIAFDAVFRLNGDPGLLMRFVTVEPVAPYHLTAGVVAFEAWHPTKAGRSTSVRLLAARRGEDPASRPADPARD